MYQQLVWLVNRSIYIKKGGLKTKCVLASSKQISGQAPKKRLAAA